MNDKEMKLVAEALEWFDAFRHNLGQAEYNMEEVEHNLKALRDLRDGTHDLTFRFEEWKDFELVRDFFVESEKIQKRTKEEELVHIIMYEF